MAGNGILIISLDFELIWGVFDLVEIEKKRPYFSNTRKIIPLTLDLFEAYGIHATWATVGMLFNESWEEWKSNIPENLPQYKYKALSAYDFGKSIAKEENCSLCFAPDLIRLIACTPGQEIGTHTYSHFYCQEEGQDRISFQDDLSTAVKLAEKLNITLLSLVFPRNQLRNEYLDICLEKGILNVRSNPDIWYWNNARSETIFTKIARTGDAYIPVGRKSYSSQDLIAIGKAPLKQKASRFLRPVENLVHLRHLKINRIKSEMTIAAKKNELYHLWWHPHNFGTHPEESLADLTLILNHFKLLQDQYGFKSCNMKEVGTSFLN